jgi:hypothetical protein
VLSSLVQELIVLIDGLLGVDPLFFNVSISSRLGSFFQGKSEHLRVLVCIVSTAHSAS